MSQYVGYGQRWRKPASGGIPHGSGQSVPEIPVRIVTENASEQRNTKNEGATPRRLFSHTTSRIVFHTCRSQSQFRRWTVLPHKED